MSETIRPLFTETAPETKYPSLPATPTQKVDVAVVGGGFTGLTTALLLRRAGKQVVLVDAGHVAAGESGFSTAQMTEMVDVGYHQLSSDFGLENARLVGSSSRSAIDWVEQTAQSNRIDCDMLRLPAYQYSDGEPQVIDQELAAAVQAGVHYSRETVQHPGFRAKAAVRVANQLQINPVKYLQGLAKVFVAEGGTIFENTKVTKIEDGAPCTVHLEGSGKLMAVDVVVATDSPICNLVFLHTKIAAYRTYVLAVELGGREPEDAFYYDTQSPYHYFRPVWFKGKKLWIMGGEDHKTGTVDHTETPYEKLEAYARGRFEVKSIPFRWSGQVMESVDGLPFIGLNSSSEHVYVGTGYAGNGTTFGTIAGMVISDLILKRPNKWTELYKATRIKPIAGATDFVTENAGVVGHLIGDYLSKEDVSSIGRIQTDSGAILTVNGQKLAVYRDAHDTVHACTAICPHLSCVVHWNSTEKSWDCPCHGSRFEATGKMVHGPATSDLKKVALQPKSKTEEVAVPAAAQGA